MNNYKIDDELRPEYDLQNLQISKLGAKRKQFCDTVQLEPDVVAAFQMLNQLAKPCASPLK